MYRKTTKMPVGQKKKLVQGKLVTSSSLSIAVSAHASEDPILTPRKSVPVMTEQASPRPEAPTLDLSDLEINASFTSVDSTSTSVSQQPPPVMLCDASHLGSSDSTEVDVIVNYIDSPAKITCHSPRSPRFAAREIQTDDDISVPIPSQDEEMTLGSDRIDRRPKIEAAKAELSKRYQADSESETCSIDEFVTKPKKIMKPLDNKNKLVAKIKKSKTQRVVASRYMTSQSTSRLLDYNKLANTTTNNATTANTSVSHKIQAKKEDRLTSTPTHSRLECFPSEFDASSIYQTSTTASSSGSMSLKKDEGAKTLSSESQQLQLDLAYTRYLQVQYLKIKEKKAYQSQEKQAMKQLNGLWLLREKKSEELGKSQMELAQIKSVLETYNALDLTQAPLAALDEKIRLVGEDYSNLCSALGNTLHQITTEDIYVPKEEERETYEEKMDSAMRESGRLLKQLDEILAKKSSSYHQYVNSLAAINSNVTDSGEELKEGRKILDEATGLCSSLMSTMVLDQQNTPNRHVLS